MDVYNKGFDLGRDAVYDKVLKEKRINYPVDYSAIIDGLMEKNKSSIDEKSLPLFSQGLNEGGIFGYNLANYVKANPSFKDIISSIVIDSGNTYRFGDASVKNIGSRNIN